MNVNTRLNMNNKQKTTEVYGNTRNRKDMEFLPAALEILETPASPVRIGFMWFICVLAACTLLWGWFGHFDIVATAQGKVQPSGRVKLIESLESGRTRAVRVKSGERVQAGDVLVELDDAEVAAEERAKQAMLSALRAEAARRSALTNELAALRHNLWQVDEKKAMTVRLLMNDDISAAIAQREEAVLRADLRGVIASLKSLAAQREHKLSEIEALRHAIGAQEALVETLNERVSMRTRLVQSSSGSRSQLIDALQEHQKAVSGLAEKQGQLQAAKAAFVVASVEGTKLVETQAADNANKQLEVLRAIDEIEQEVIKAKARRKRMTIHSPVEGTVQLVSITTIGQVVTSGTELMRVVPAEASLEIEAFLSNKDIGFVAAAQPAIIKVEAYPFTRFGVLEGKVVRVSSDAIPEPDAQQMESTIVKNARSSIPTGNVPRVQNLVFPITITLEKADLIVDGRSMPVTPGMSVTVEIKTGKRRILEYLFSPLAQITSEAMGER